MLVLWWAAQKVVMGRMRPAGRRLPTPESDHSRVNTINIETLVNTYALFVSKNYLLRILNFPLNVVGPHSNNQCNKIM